jgi:D-glycero-alpha-D-manno-heptose-7-phosphate kinase
MFAVAAYFGEDGIEIIINSTSPPRSGLGGSSAAAVALIGGYLTGLNKERVQKKNIALLAHALEGSVAGVPCGIQDQLAAAYGGVHSWHWLGSGDRVSYRKRMLILKRTYKAFEKNLLLAYCGIPHESKQVNHKWVSQFMAGRFRERWIEIINCTRAFSDALVRGDMKAAAGWMNRETAIRRRMTPEVLEPVGRQLVSSAVRLGCGARFTGAGGGGCIWALGESHDIQRLKDRWTSTLSKHPTSKLLNVEIASQGLLVE